MGINSERNVTNQSFKGKISEIISILSGETYTPTPAANDTEMLNCGTFEYYMNILKENISSGGGGSGAEDYIVTFNITYVSESEITVTSNRTAAQIYEPYTQGKNVKGIATAEGTTVLFFLSYIMIEDEEFFGVAFHAFGMEGGLMRITGSASSESWNGTLLDT